MTEAALAELSIAAHSGEIRRASAWLEKAGLGNGVPADQIHRLDLCLNEVLANIITHDGDTALTFPICLHLEVHQDQGRREAQLTVSDAGEAFNPLAQSPQPQAKTLAEAEPGGLGLRMIHSFADKHSYCFSEGRNRLSFSVCWSDPR